MPKYHRPTRLTYARCGELLASRRLGTIAPNTRLVWEVDYFSVRFHGTTIIRVYPDDSLRLYTGGFRTHTTKERLNRFTGAGVHQLKGDWLVQGVPFEEGILIRPDGMVDLVAYINPLPDGRADLLAKLGIKDCPIHPAAPEVAADWLEEHNRDKEASLLRWWLGWLREQEKYP